jgi:hypothetical protein
MWGYVIAFVLMLWFGLAITDSRQGGIFSKSLVVLIMIVFFATALIVFGTAINMIIRELT